MKKRLKKKKYQEYVDLVLLEVSCSPYYRKKFREAEAFDKVKLDVTNPELFSEWIVQACKWYGLVFCGDRTEFTDEENMECMIVVLPDNDQLGGVFNASYNNLIYL